MSVLLQLNLLVILALFFILLSRCLIVSPQFINLASYLFVIFEGLETLSTFPLRATSLIHSKLDYCNSFFLNLPQSQLGRLQFILNSSARAVSKTPKFAHISPVLKPLHWLKLSNASIAKFFNQNNLLISTAFSMFNLTVLLAPLTSSLCNVLHIAHVLNWQVVYPPCSCTLIITIIFISFSTHICHTCSVSTPFFS